MDQHEPMQVFWRAVRNVSDGQTGKRQKNKKQKKRPPARRPAGRFFLYSLSFFFVFFCSLFFFSFFVFFRDRASGRPKFFRPSVRPKFFPSVRPEILRTSKRCLVWNPRYPKVQVPLPMSLIGANTCSRWSIIFERPTLHRKVWKSLEKFFENFSELEKFSLRTFRMTWESVNLMYFTVHVYVGAKPSPIPRL